MAEDDPTDVADGVFLTVDGRDWGGWTEATVELGLEQLAGRFSLTLTERWPGNPAGRAIAPGRACRLALGGETLIEGWIDAVEIVIDAQSHSLRVTGRDRTGDLVDCGVADGPTEFRGLRLDELARRLLAPFGIAVRVEAELGPPFKRFSVEPGETVGEALERAARYRALLLVADGTGGIALTRAGAGAGGGWRVGFGGLSDPISRQISRDWSGRFSLTRVVGQDDTEGASATQLVGPAGHARDSAITRHRPTVIVADRAADAGELQTRAAWANRISIGRSARLSVRLAGWKAPGRLVRPNSLGQVREPALAGADAGDWLTVAVRYTLDAGGRIVELQLARPQAYDLLAEPEQEAP